MELTLKDITEKYLSPKLTVITISNPVSREIPDPAHPPASKVRIRPCLIKGQVMFQFTETVGPKELHSNYEKAAAAEKIAGYLGGIFKQAEFKSHESFATVLVSKKGKMTIKDKKLPGSSAPSNQPETAAEVPCTVSSHNKKKSYIINEGDTHVPFMVDLGIMTTAGKIVNARYDKFRQINRYLEFIRDILPDLKKAAKGGRLSIIDFGCGKSYLTFAMYYYLHEIEGLDLDVTGLDLKADVIEHCNALAKSYGYTGLRFLHGDIADYELSSGNAHVDMVVTLHACDTATDYALYKAIRWGASCILCVPCCQHEVNRQIENESLKGILRYGLLKERISALVTDGLRADLLEEMGYRTQVLEFIDMEHTPKNILIRAVKQPLSPKAKQKASLDIMKELNVKPTLYSLLYPEHGEAWK